LRDFSFLYRKADRPVARVLMKAHEGDIVEVRAPSRVEQIEVLEICYGGVRGETE
jgi:transcription elongation GreA/GreB family factor